MVLPTAVGGRPAAAATMPRASATQPRLFLPTLGGSGVHAVSAALNMAMKLPSTCSSRPVRTGEAAAFWLLLDAESRYPGSQASSYDRSGYKYLRNCVVGTSLT